MSFGPWQKSDAVFEALKEVLRWGLLFTVSWFITVTLQQVVNVPEFYELRIWVFEYFLPIRLMFQVGLTGLGRLVDRVIHDADWTRLNGILPF